MLVNTGASHNFISGEEAARLGLRVEKDSSKMKAVNSEAKPVQGVAKGVGMKVGDWIGTINFIVVSMVWNFYRTLRLFLCHS